MAREIVCVLNGHPPSDYLFDSRHADCNKLAEPTVLDVLEDMAENHHVECGCASRVGRTAWLVSCPPTDEAIEALDLGKTPSLSLDTPLGLLLQSYRSKRFNVHRHAGARVYQRFGDAPQLPTSNIRNYERICSIRGLTFVDKMAYIVPILEHLTTPHLVVIRRPAGFGKTTFLTMLECFFDIPSIHAYFPFAEFEHQLDPLVASAHRRLMVLVLDFNQLELRDMMSLDDVENECDRFLEQAATNFYGKYMPYLGSYGALQGNCEITLDATLHAARTQGYQIFLSIDNYTAPTKYGSPGLVQLVGESILTVLASLIRLGRIRCGAMFGDPVPYTAPWTGAGYYDKYTNDLTDDPAFTCAIGFTHGEVEALGQALSIELASCIAPARPDADQDGPLPSPMVYCAAEVMSVAHALLSGDAPGVERQTVAIFPALPEPASSDSDESMYEYSGDNEPLDDDENAPLDDENALSPASAIAPCPVAEPNYVDGSDYETLWYAFVGSRYPNAKPLADMDLEKLARIAAASPAPPKSETGLPPRATSPRSNSNHPSMPTVSAISESSSAH